MLVAHVDSVYEIVEWSGIESIYSTYPDWVLDLVESGNIYANANLVYSFSVPKTSPEIVLPLRMGDFLCRTSAGRISTMSRDEFINEYKVIDDGGLLELEEMFYTGR